MTNLMLQYTLLKVVKESVWYTCKLVYNLTGRTNVKVVQMTYLLVLKFKCLLCLQDLPDLQSSFGMLSLQSPGLLKSKSMPASPTKAGLMNTACLTPPVSPAHTITSSKIVFSTDAPSLIPEERLDCPVLTDKKVDDHCSLWNWSLIHWIKVVKGAIFSFLGSLVRIYIFGRVISFSGVFFCPSNFYFLVNSTISDESCETYLESRLLDPTLV